jgi:hypothetical protein
MSFMETAFPLPPLPSVGQAVKASAAINKIITPVKGVAI